MDNTMLSRYIASELRKRGTDMTTGGLFSHEYWQTIEELYREKPQKPSEVVKMNDFENATNGEVIKTLFPQMHPKRDNWGNIFILFDNKYYLFSPEWWGAQYRSSLCNSCIHHGLDANNYPICRSPKQAHHEGNVGCPDYAD